MKVDKALVFLALATVSGGLIFTLLASSDYLFMESESARGPVYNNISVVGNTYDNPAEIASFNSSTPMYNSVGSTIFYEERMFQSTLT